MNKTIIFSVILASILAPLFTFAQNLESPVRAFRFVEAKSVQETPALPPSLEMTLEIMCNETVVQNIRYESIDPDSQKVTIALGALVKENLASRCTGEKREITVPAGNSFSGREYEITRIKK